MSKILHAWTCHVFGLKVPQYHLSRDVEGDHVLAGSMKSSKLPQTSMTVAMVSDLSLMNPIYHSVHGLMQLISFSHLRILINLIFAWFPSFSFFIYSLQLSHFWILVVDNFVFISAWVCSSLIAIFHLMDQFPLNLLISLWSISAISSTRTTCFPSSPWSTCWSDCWLADVRPRSRV